MAQSVDALNVPIAVAAFVLSLSSFAVSQIAARETARAEAMRALLGDRETVAFAALKLMQQGLPKRAAERNLTVAAIMQACVFVSSDRARALLYGVIARYQPRYRGDFANALALVEETFDSMAEHGFNPDELNLKNGRVRISAVKKVMKVG